jgi:GH35 family endo-1,4-beta-xylanase
MLLRAQAHGVRDIILELGMTPFWASSRPEEVGYHGNGSSAPQADIQAWRDYISTVAKRYKGVIRYLVVWNEANADDWYTGTVAQLVDLTRAGS